ncbi:Clp protease N-terminal domain-containing protein [Thermopolyspora sp. NPDC052614]|uniref:Clp protease N-terminal domain-containing protein n=1 Tax=Thermopolyspora sp. NPDC052614 TaxID=3155682 RepID=UPI003442FB03
MFERFTKEARKVAIEAQTQARQLDHGHIGTEHVLLAMLATPDSASCRVLTRHGLTHDAAATTLRTLLKEGDDLDADLLGEIGIDLNAVKEKVEAAFGPGALDRAGRRGGRSPIGHIPFTRRAKKTLELALREAVALKHNHIADGHILLGLLRERDGLGGRIIAEHGLDFDALRREIIDEFD